MLVVPIKIQLNDLVFEHPSFTRWPNTHSFSKFCISPLGFYASRYSTLGETRNLRTQFSALWNFPISLWWISPPKCLDSADKFWRPTNNWREFKICRVFEILPIRRNVEHRSAVATVYPEYWCINVLEVQTFYKNDQAVCNWRWKIHKAPISWYYDIVW